MSARIHPRVLLVRHGRTALNAAGLLRGRLDPDLDNVGLAEVEALAEVLATRRPIRVVCSPLHRAVQTASAIAHRAGVRAEVDIWLTDRDYGDWAGHLMQDVVDEWGSLDAAPGVEPVDHVRYRATVALDEQVGYLDDQRPVVMVSHDAVNRILLSSLEPELGPERFIGQRTACWNEIEHVDGRWRVLLVDQKPTDFAAPPDPPARQMRAEAVIRSGAARGHNGNG